jgi:hypothetical protein
MMGVAQNVLDFISAKRRESNAWRRVLLDGKGKLHADGKLILKSLMGPAKYFDVGYVPNDPDRTLIMAVRRETVNRILRLLKFDEAALMELMTDE